MANSTITVTEVGQTTLQAYINTVGGVANVKTEATVPVDQTGTPFGTAANPLRVNPTGTTTQPVSGTVTANQGTANTLANAWPTKLTDGTNSPAIINAAPAAAVYGIATQSVLYGFNSAGQYFPVNVEAAGVDQGLVITGGINDNSAGVSTNTAVATLPAEANANQPSGLTEGLFVTLSTDLNRNLRTISKIVDPYTGTAARVDSNGNLVVANGTPVVHASQGLTTTPPTYTPFNIYAPPQIPNTPTRQYNGIYR